MPRTIPWGLHKDPHGENEGTRGGKTDTVDKTEISPVEVKRHSEPNEPCPAQQKIDSPTRGMKS